MVKKKSLFEKLGLVESTGDQRLQDAWSEDVRNAALGTLVTDYGSSTDEQEFSLDFEVNENFLTVEKIYEKAELSDMSGSIFKVEEFGKHLPDNLPSEVKRQSVVGILTASGLELVDLLQDAQNRTNALEGVSVLTVGTSKTTVSEKEQEISDLSDKIDVLKQEIIDAKSTQEQQDILIHAEVSRINSIVKFVSPKYEEERL